MAKEKVSEEEIERLQRGKHQDALIAALEKVASRNDSETLERLTQFAKQTEALLSVLTKKDFSTDIKPLVTELSSSLKELNTRPLVNELSALVKKLEMKKPKSFLIERNQSTGLIERVIVET